MQWGMVFALLMLTGCNALHVAKLYYDEYINPKASIDYDAEKIVSMPEEVLHSYTQVDSSVTRVVDQLSRVEFFPDAMWFAAVEQHLPQVARWVTLDGRLMPAGGVGLEDDQALELFVTQISAPQGVGALVLQDTVAVVRKFQESSGENGYIVALLDPRILDQAKGLAMVVGDVVVRDGAIAAGTLEKLQAEAAKVKAFAGERSIDSIRYGWVRSVRDQVRMLYIYRIYR
jgi:hypothetical protein